MSRPAVIAHRGARLRAPENTIEAFEAAIEAGADAIECDARLSADGQIVVCHSDHVDDTTDGSGAVSELTFVELRSLDAGARFNPNGDFPYRGRGVRVPLLAEVLELAAGRVWVDVEVKNLPGQPGFDSPKEALVEALAHLLAGRSPDSLVISSFNWVSLERARELVAGVATGFLTAPAVDMSVNLAYVREHGHRICLPHLETLSRDGGAKAVADARADGRDVIVWTVEEPGRAVDLARVGVTGLIADDPEAVLAELAARGAGSL